MLHYREWDERWVERALESGTLDLQDDFGITPVWHAVYFGKSEWVTRLLDAGARPDADDSAKAERACGESYLVSLRHSDAQLLDGPRGKSTLLHVACASRKPAEMVRLLLARGFEVNARDAVGSPPIHIASWCDHDAAVGLLLEAGADPDIVDGVGYTALDHSHTDEVFARLLAAGASADGGPRRPSPLDWARSIVHVYAHVGNERALRDLLSHGAHADRHPTALLAAARAGHGACVRLLLDHGASVRGHQTWELGSLLQAAAASGKIEACEPLVDAFPDELDAAVVTATRYAHDDGTNEERRGGRVALVGWLVDRGADPGRALVAVAKATTDAFACMLVDKGAPVGSVDDAGESALIHAARGGHRRLADMLLARGADAKAKAADGTSAYDVAAQAYKKLKIDDARFVMSSIASAGGRPEPPREKSAATTAAKVASAGARVSHATFGLGTIVSIAGDKWAVTFDGGQTRTLVSRVLTLV